MLEKTKLTDYFYWLRKLTLHTFKYNFCVQHHSLPGVQGGEGGFIFYYHLRIDDGFSPILTSPYYMEYALENMKLTEY